MPHFFLSLVIGSAPGTFDNKKKASVICMGTLIIIFNEFHINLSPIKIAPPEKWWGNFDQNTKSTVTLITSKQNTLYLELAILDRSFYNISNQTNMQFF